MAASSGSKPAKQASKRVVVFLLLFALPFAGGGTFVGYLAASQVRKVVRARSWEEVPARILSADLDVNYGDDSTTYRVTARYEYNYLGETYTSDRVSFGVGSDNIGTFHQDAYRELDGYRDSGRSFRAFVDPDDPTEAVLYRDLRWGLLVLETIFALVFGLVGYGLIFAALFGNRLAKEADTLRARHPDEPWLWEADWTDGRIQAASKGKMIGASIFAVLWNLISAPVLVFVPGEVASGNLLALIAFLFPAIGLLLAGYAGYTILQWRKFGTAELELFRNPGVLGGYLEGRIHTNIRGTRHDARLTLSCIRKETSGSGKNRSTHEKVLWQDAIDVPAAALLAGPRGASIPVRFAIPYDAGPPTDKEAGAPVEWRLEAEAELPGIDFSAHFDVPVFLTPDSDPGLVAGAQGATPGAHDAEDGFANAGGETTRLARAGIVRTESPGGGVAYVFRRARAKGAAIGLTAFTAIWCGLIWLMIHLEAPVFFPIMFGLFALLMFAGLGDLWLKETRVEVANGTLTFTRRLLAAGRKITFDLGAIDRLELAGGMQAGNKLYYQVVLRMRDGKKYALAAQIEDQRTAKRLIADLESALVT